MLVVFVVIILTGDDCERVDLALEGCQEEGALAGEAPDGERSKQGKINCWDFGQLEVTDIRWDGAEDIKVYQRRHLGKHRRETNKPAVSLIGLLSFIWLAV